MASLTIDCFLDCDHVLGRRKNLPLQLEFCPLHTKDSPPSNEQWRMVSTLDGPCLAMSNQVSLFRLQLIRPNVEPVDAVLKIDHSGQRCHELKAEATAYRALLVNFQGKIIPKFYGCFATVINDRHITCLITEYSGEPLHTYLATTDAAFLTKLLNAVIHLHHCGAEHGDLDENNILTAKDGRPILIDLERVKPHSCQRRLEFRQGVIAPTEEEFGCPELYDLCMRMGYWQSLISKVLL
ncbi:hypothetical protein C8R47DRAFT_529192 [Mycena vitilis]|nr:hypothetical protein C8R47DRAFT_529192 [Mycena vitilis]